MSSLLQHKGKVDRHGVHIAAYKVVENPKYPGSPTCGDPCEIGPHGHPVLYTFARKPKGMFGCWVVFRINGKDAVPDLSIPLSMFKLPRDAKRMSDEECKKYWETP